MPTVRGDVAVYAEVRPGIDLVVRTGALGFSQYLVVKTKQAAADPLLQGYDLELRATGGQVSTVDGEVRFIRAADGKRVFGMAPPNMWETKGVTGTGAALSAAAVEAPVVGRSAMVGMSMSGNRLRLVPDAGLLRASDASFPVVIDPAWSHQVKDYWHMVWSDGQSFNNSPTENARVGYDGWSDHKRSRVFYRFQTAPWRGKQVTSATFGHKQIHSPNFNCRAGSYGPDVELWWTGAISPSMTWANQTPWIELVSRSGLASGNSTTCPFSEQEWDATGLVNRLNNYPDVTFGLRSADENNRDGWRQYSHVGGAGFPFLRVTFNSPPNTPAVPWVGLNPPVDGGFTRGPDVALRSWVSDPDGDEVKARNHVRRPGDTDSRFVEGQGVRNESSNSVVTGLGEGHWWYSGQAVETQWPHAQSGWSDTRSFQVDQTAPSSPTVQFTGASLEPQEPGRFKVRSGTKVGVTVPPPSPDVWKYVWGVQTSPTIEQVYPAPDVKADPLAMWHLNPAPMSWDVTFNQISKVVKFQIKAVDWAGNESAVTEYSFDVNADEVHRYKLDQNGQDARPAQANVTTGPWADLNAPGHHYFYPDSQDVRACDDRAYRLTRDYLRPTVEGEAYLNTQSAFSVSAWVQLSELPPVGADASTGAVSLVRGWPGSVFLLGTHRDAAGTLRWAAGVDSSPGDSDKAWAESAEEVRLGQWVHLTGVWTHQTRTITLFVNGQQAGTATSVGILPQADFLGIGMAPNHADRPLAQWKGVVDDVRVFAGALDAGLINRMKEEQPDENTSCTNAPS